MLTQVEAARELIAREDALRSIHGFMEYMRPTGLVEFRYMPVAHHEVLIAELEDLWFSRGEAVAQAVELECRNLSLTMPPNSAKTTYTSIIFVMWIWAQMPTMNILCVSNVATFAEELNRRRREIAKTQEWQNLSGTHLLSDAKGVQKFVNTMGGSISAHGGESSIVGRRSDVTVVDDLIQNDEHANSLDRLNKTWDWVCKDLDSRLDPAYGLNIHVGTRWAVMDPFGRIDDAIKADPQTAREWKVIRMPMECDDPENDPMGREEGELLWPERLGRRHADKFKEDIRTWRCMFQQLPMVDIGSWINPEDIKIVEDRLLPSYEDLTIAIGVDLALSDGKGDWSVVVVCGLDKDGNMTIIDLYRDRVMPDKLADVLFSYAELYSPHVVLCDNDNASKVFGNSLEIEFRTRQKTFPWKLMPMRGRDKETRAWTLRGLFNSGVMQIKRASWTGTILNEIAEFGTGKGHDDIIDALSLIGREYVVLPKPNQTDFRSESPLKQTIFEKDGQMFLHKSLDMLFDER